MASGLEKLPRKTRLNTEIFVNERKKFKLVTKGTWKWVIPGAVPVHEGYHGAAAIDQVIGMTRIPDGTALGATFYEGEFDPAMAAAPAAFGCGGCGGDHEATLANGYNWETSKGSGRSRISGREKLAWLLASALEESGTLSQQEVQEVARIWRDGEEVSAVITHEDGRQETVALGYRVKGKTVMIPMDIVESLLAEEEKAEKKTGDTIPFPRQLTQRDLPKTEEPITEDTFRFAA